MDNKGKSKFVRVVCSRCGFSQVIFGKSSIKTKCAKCNRRLVRVGGGKVKIDAIVKEVFK
jgi:ribosomal protein S27E